MIVTITDYQGRSHYLAPEAIARISEAGVSSQWHGIRCVVKCFDGSVIEAGDTADRIAAAIREATKPLPERCVTADQIRGVTYRSGTLTVDGLALTPAEATIATRVAECVAEEACQQFAFHDGNTYADLVRRYFGILEPVAEEEQP